MRMTCLNPAGTAPTGLIALIYQVNSGGLSIPATAIAQTPVDLSTCPTLTDWTGHTFSSSDFASIPINFSGVTLTAGNFYAVYFGGLTPGVQPPGIPAAPPSISVGLTSTTFQSTFGQTVTFTAVVFGGGGVQPPSGTVQFLDTATVLATVSLNNGLARFSTAALSVGQHTIVATYSSSGSGPPVARSTFGMTVVGLASAVTLSTNPSNPVYGQSIILTANVIGSVTTPAGSTSPTGQVTFTLQPASSSGKPTTLGTANLVSGAASFTLNTPGVGTQTIVAQYSGDSVWSASSHQTAVTVSAASSSASVSLSVSGGAQLVLTSAVVPVAPGAGSPTGTVQFVNTSTKAVVASGSLSAGKTSVTVASGAASTVLGVPIAAQYSGDGNFSSSTSAPLPVPVNAAGDLTTRFAADEIASLFGVTGLNGDAGPSPPLTTSLAGAAVNITDSAGTTRPASLYSVFASAGQINFVVPGATAPGLAQVAIATPGGGTLTTAVNVANSAAGIFTASMTGQGPYAGQVVYANSDGSQNVISSVSPGSGVAFAPNPISLNGNSRQVYLVLYCTGVRHAASVTAAINGVSVPVAYVGAQQASAGLDQINLGPLPASLTGAGLVNVIVTADSQPANTVTALIQ